MLFYFMLLFIFNYPIGVERSDQNSRDKSIFEFKYDLFDLVWILPNEIAMILPTAKVIILYIVLVK